MTPERKLIVARIREEGRKASLAGKSKEANPHKDMDSFQWWTGYRWGELEKEAEAHERQQDAYGKACAVAQRIMGEAYSGTAANSDWDSEFDVNKAAEIIFDAYDKEDPEPYMSHGEGA